ncbi:dicarboxylate transporter/tellurite-resistance protein TehA [Aggregatibacter aphrophilus]|uniref:dicarboxylate transporter/tellurite-resistance protein TehA n=1 Tax=Aggregatibacter aphrophilus TaxID=732 RepID=UPI0009F2BFC2|nr:dicarboxylate transporter/tellurite-resistance protein TehA [Aggregatibacter aphrophilus]PNL92505.1 dicarboxylate transporter/tellurite-resistance protein TehA [Aggregatibacter aphrophilus]
MEQQKPFPIPVSYFSIVLGLSALGLAWRYGAHAVALPALVGETLLGLATVIWLIFIVAYGVKWLRFRHQAKEELQNLIQCCFISLIPITTILIGLVALPYGFSLSVGLITLGIIGQLVFAAYRAAGLWRGIHKAEATTPIMYLPTVATNFVSGTALGYLGYSEVGMLFLGAGVFSWLSLEPAILHRLRNLEPVAPAVRPAIGIQLAPAFVGCSTYLALNGGEIDLLVKLLIGYGVLQLLFLIRLLPWLFQNGFMVSFWAFSFGLASMANVGLHLYQGTTDTILSVVGLSLFWFASMMIGLLILGTLYLIMRGRFFVK